MQEKLDDYKKQIEETGSAAAIQGRIVDDESGVEFQLYYFAQQEYLQKDSD